MQNKPLFNDPSIFPSEEKLQNVLGKNYIIFAEMSKNLTENFGLIFQWKYYNDSKAWLCKVSFKNKTVFWLSIWDGFFRTSFYFLERHLEGVAALETDENSFTIEKEWGKMIPLIFNISQNKQLRDLYTIVEFKKNLK
ncbi:MAG: DUF3788 domain-containing protein [Paludibacter sp.]|nr:DUF3788 domain-containing protein [Paludibacter sp.]